MTTALDYKQNKKAEKNKHRPLAHVSWVYT